MADIVQLYPVIQSRDYGEHQCFHKQRIVFRLVFEGGDLNGQQTFFRSHAFSCCVTGPMYFHETLNRVWPLDDPRGAVKDVGEE